MIRACFHKFAEMADYPRHPPFDPPERFPELAGVDCIGSQTDTSNRIYPAVREVLAGLGLDAKHLRGAEWNPFGKFVKRGQTVLIKPNLVTHVHPQGENGIFWTISHPSIIRVLVDYALLSVGAEGRVIIGDTPIENCDFRILCEISGLRDMVDTLRQRGNGNLELLDFRTFQTTQYPDSTVAKTDLPGDPRGYTDIDLGRLSLFQELEDRNGTQNYYTLGDHTVDHMNPRERKPGMPNGYHSSGRHVYRVPNTVLQSDFIISLAKLKTHRFSGVTLCLKNIVGICQGKEYLPHRRPGTLAEGGDSFMNYPSANYVGKLRLRRAVFSLMGGKNSERLRKIYRKIFAQKPAHEVYSEPLFGDWWGNDTIWRAILDLNLILMHADIHGFDPENTKRTYLGIIDGVVGMDHEAPMTGLPVRSNLLIAGIDPAAADILGTYMMGLDPRKIITINGVAAGQCHSLGENRLAPDQVKGNMSPEDARCAFVPTKGWKDFLLGPSPENKP